jgi:uncharacterized protein (UPF0212 family)
VTEGTLNIEISSSSGGMENEVEIRDKQDLQVAVKALQLAARYEFDEEVNVEFGSDSMDEELRDLAERVDQLDEELDGVEQDVGGVIEDVSSSVGEKDLEELREKVSEIQDLVESDHDSVNREDDESSSSKTEEDLDPEEADTGDDSGGNYTCSDCGKSFDSAVKTRSTHHDCDSEESGEEDSETEDKEAESGREECPHCGEDFDPRGLNKHEPNCSENPENQEDEENDSLDLDESQLPNEEKSSVERNAEAMADAAPEPDTQEEDDSSKDVEWKSIKEAVGEYKDDHSLKYLINREHEKRYTSPMMAQSFASTNQAQDWAAVEELPEGY